MAYVVRNVAAEESNIVPTRLTEATRDKASGDEPERSRVVAVDLARLDLRHAELACRVGLSFRFPYGFAPTDDVATVGGRLRERGLV